jgi:signal transduction histidine kinase
MLSLSIISGGVILIGISFKSASSGTNELFITSLNLFSMTIPFVCVASFFIAKAFTEPIMQLIEGTRAVSEGKFDYELNIKTGDEIEELANTFTESKAGMESFVYTVAHDLKTPLVTIQGVAGMLKKDLKEGKREHVELDLQYIEEAITRMDGLLHDTIKFSQVDSVENLPECVSFSELVQDALELTKAKIEARGVEVFVAGDFPVVYVDRRRIVEALVNLITNSINNMGEQPYPAIHIGHRVDDGQTVFFVKDNGIGIEPSQHEKVFGLFYKVDRESKGTGAGLAIVKRIIDRHGGRIWIESEEEKGCTICSILPCAT